MEKQSNYTAIKKAILAEYKTENLDKDGIAQYIITTLEIDSDLLHFLELIPEETLNKLSHREDLERLSKDLTLTVAWLSFLTKEKLVNELEIINVKERNHNLKELASNAEELATSLFMLIDLEHLRRKSFIDLMMDEWGWDIEKVKFRRGLGTKYFLKFLTVEQSDLTEVQCNILFNLYTKEELNESLKFMMDDVVKFTKEKK